MGRQVEKKRKKKGRPSLLDLQKRSLRLQKQHEEQQHQQQLQRRNPNPSTNPYARFPNPPADRRPPRRNPNPDPEPPSSTANVGDGAAAAASVEDDEEDDEPAERRKEKKLKLVLHIPHPDANSSDAPPESESDSEGNAPKKRKIDAVGKEDPQDEESDLDPRTPMPDKNLLEFILDRLQKKDIYGVFSEPVDPDELPDYHDIIKHPMDFQTVRNKLLSGAYKNLEHFEKDVFLISSNAMRYNASDTIYFRQARSIHELAKKNFENLRQASDESEPEPKIVRRGRPPGTGKNNIKRPVGKLPAENAPSEYSSEARLANVVNKNHISHPWYDILSKGTVLHNPGIADISARSAVCVQSSEAYIPSKENNSVASDDYSGSVWKGSSNYGKNIFATDDNRRDTYKQYPLSSISEFSVLTALVGERKVLVPVGFHMEHAYARSLARFAAHLGPIGWKLAAMRIKKALPPGTKFGPGWVGKNDATQQSQHPPLLSTPCFHPSSVLSDISTASGGDDCSEMQAEFPLNESAEQEQFRIRLNPLASVSAAAPSIFPDSNEAKAYSQFCQIPMMQPPSNGFKAPFAPNLHQPGKFH